MWGEVGWKAGLFKKSVYVLTAAAHCIAELKYMHVRSAREC